MLKEDVAYGGQNTTSSVRIENDKKVCRP